MRKKTTDRIVRSTFTLTDMPIKGSYILLIRVQQPLTLTVGRLGMVVFMPGFYAYVGSALASLDKRIQRHLSPHRKMFWHIDYLTKVAEIIEVFRIEREERLECIIVRQLSKLLPSVKGFGCSDCSCKSHLFYHRRRNTIIGDIKECTRITVLLMTEKEQ